MKSKCELEAIKSMSKARFPLPKNSGVCLPAVAKKVEGFNSVVVKYDVESNQGGASYVNICVEDLGLSFNVYRNGKVVVWHTLSPKALAYFLDFFYYSVVVNCLEDLK